MATMTKVADGHHEGRSRGRAAGTLSEQFIEVGKFWLVMAAAFALVCGVTLTAIGLLSGG